MKIWQIAGIILLLIATIIMGGGCRLQNETKPQESKTQSTSGTQDPAQVSWEMSAMLVTADSYIQESFEISVDGEIIAEESGTISMALEVQTPDTFRYVYAKPDTGLPVSVSGKTDGLSYYVWTDYSYDRNAKDYCFASYALCPEKGYLIMTWDDGEDLFLVASRDTDADPSTILDYFQGFIDHYAFEH